MKKAIVVLILASSAFASIGKVVSYPARHPKKSAHHLKAASQHVGHAAKKILY